MQYSLTSHPVPVQISCIVAWYLMSDDKKVHTDVVGPIFALYKWHPRYELIKELIWLKMGLEFISVAGIMSSFYARQVFANSVKITNQGLCFACFVKEGRSKSPLGFGLTYTLRTWGRRTSIHHWQHAAGMSWQCTSIVSDHHASS